MRSNHSQILLEAKSIPKRPLGSHYFPSLILKRGEVVRLIGGNGSGKSTILRALSGNMYDDRLVLKSNQAFLLSDQSLDVFGLSVADLLKYMSIVYAFEGDLDEAAKHLKMIQNYMIHELSLGQKQQVKLMSLVMVDADIWLLDEPDRGLDHTMLKWLNRLIAKHIQKGRAVLYASHIDQITTSRVEYV